MIPHPIPIIPVTENDVSQQHVAIFHRYFRIGCYIYIYIMLCLYIPSIYPFISWLYILLVAGQSHISSMYFHVKRLQGEAPQL